ncbi:endolytic transglycosylase MltG [Rhodococcus rhodochrous]|uniref:endolytic transglycosylase MltG n=1 Tax=Rhodococcus rhodochrous TaxID=1829 RepID=UPI001E339B0C|nr:endolytic transglycosylase MltG [Rhodococcus rhodochrous]MCD2095752.1 endolytic transglycosylase MltG [Rhodococcus rhodochrous]MCD2119814.1 endolytic transglycosylase MltG [Rhodococcus rhodochrous]MCQ4134859.1 endolytic transglycosylase MltG [Rhodococcus rhodochrous]MDJ0016678.1 endolytic transglycosylase MltG [Rhodococcus rhodochrous]
MSRHGRHDDHSENAREDLFADPYAGGYTQPPVDRTGSEDPYRTRSEDPYRSEPGYRYDDPYASDPHGHDAYGHDPYGGGAYEGAPGETPEARRPDPDDHETTVLNFEPGVFDGPPPGHPEQGYPEQGYADPAYGEQGYAEEHQGYVEQGYAEQGYAEQGYGESYAASGYEHAGPTDADAGYAPAGHSDGAPLDGGHLDDEYPGGYSYAARDANRDAYRDDDPADDAVAAEEITAEQRAVPAAVGGSERAARRDPKARGRKKRGRVVGALAAAVLLLVVVGGGYLAYDRFLGTNLPPDFTGPPGPAVVVQVNPGETAGEIGSEFVDKGVVASSAAFYEAAVQNPGMNSLQPGFYQVATNIPAVDAVAALVDPASRVGALVISEGRQLHDIRDVNTGAVRKGIYTLIAEASCHGDPAAENCVTYEELDAAGATPDLQALGVPEWARDAVANVPDRRRQLEGLIAAGSWDFDPTAEPVEILARLVSESASSYDATGITEAAARVGLTPYEMLISASLVEREALPQDFAKVARVILNRLDIDQMLQFDSTVNYELDETELATTDADRARVTPWNTYAMVGLPATPISSPSIGALQAMENPEPGEWIYFVTIDDQGTTLFANSYEEHLQNTELALASGILDSGR